MLGLPSTTPTYKHCSTSASTLISHFSARIYYFFEKPKKNFDMWLRRSLNFRIPYWCLFLLLSCSPLECFSRLQWDSEIIGTKYKCWSTFFDCTKSLDRMLLVDNHSIAPWCVVLGTGFHRHINHWSTLRLASYHKLLLRPNGQPKRAMWLRRFAETKCRW